MSANSTYSDRKQFVKDRGLSFKCLKPNFSVQECPNTVACSNRNSDGVMHSDSFCTSKREKGGETTQRNSINNENSKVGPPQVTSKYTSVIDGDYKSCAKIVLVNVVVDSNPVNKIKCYASVDEQ